jgi:glycosyltransferase involved in cell wall biosynthesis
MHPDTIPLVSVIIPTHDSARFIAQAVQGVLAQTYGDYELIVIDDGSRDDTREVLQPFAGHIRYHRQDNRGPAAARNAGIKIARGEFLCFLDADDIWHPNKLALQTEFMAAHNEIALLFADAEVWEETTIQPRSYVATMIFGADLVSQLPLQEAFRKLVIENFIPTSTVMVRKACLLKAGLFDEDLQNAEDRDMWLRVAANSEIACLPQWLARKRGHGANISARTEMTLRSRIKVWDKARRRFPTLAPAALYNRMLAGAYQELGFILLAQAEGRAARQCGVASLRNATRYVMATTSTFPYRWFLSMALVLLSFIPWPLVRSLWRAWNYVFRRVRGQQLGSARPSPQRS